MLYQALISKSGENSFVYSVQLCVRVYVCVYVRVFAFICKYECEIMELETFIYLFQIDMLELRADIL